MKRVMLALCSVLATLAVVVGCSAGSSPASSPSASPSTTHTQWVKVASGHLSGARPATVDLGVHRLGHDTRVSWALSGPQYPPATLTFRAVGSNGATYANSIPPQKPPNTLRSGPTTILGLLLKPDDYHLYFSQRFPRSGGPGFDIAFTVLTTP